MEKSNAKPAACSPETNVDTTAPSPLVDRKQSRQNLIFSLAAVVFMLIVSVLFFFPDDLRGNVLMQSDTQQGIANSHEIEQYQEQTGENPRWTNSLMSGMPTFQISPSYKASPVLNFLQKVYSLWLPEPANLLFMMMLGFFIMCLCMKFKWPTALFGALAWGFSTYFIIIIGAGHIWKFITLAYIPPTIGGIALCYRGKYLPGFALASLFGALQLKSNHPQMTYYFLFVILAMMIGWLIMAVRNGQMKQWLIATACIVGAGGLGVAANAAHLYANYQYQKETIRGRATDLVSEGQKQASGLDKEYMTAWSYSGDETFTLLIPNVKGGASLKPVGDSNWPKRVIDLENFPVNEFNDEEMQEASQFLQYFGDQPMTNGPVYVGAVVLLLAVMAFFCWRGPMRWCLLGVMIIAILLSWGHNFWAPTDFFIEYVPFYNKFRTVSSILVIVEFVLPLLAVYTLHNMITDKEWWQKYSRQFYVVFGVGAFICLVGWMWPGVFGDALSYSEREQLKELGFFNDPAARRILDAVTAARLSLVSSDCLRSLLFIVLGGGLIWAYYNSKALKPAGFVLCMAGVVLIDLYSVNKRYVNSENFTEPFTKDEIFAVTPGDEQILKDKSYYRVFNVLDNGGARSSYLHKTIGGYHAAKLTRYADLDSHMISPYASSIMQYLREGGQLQDLATADIPVLNMLNAKYFLVGDYVVENQTANGNAWFVDKVDYVPDANAEMKALENLDNKHVAVADKKFEKSIGKAQPKAPGDTIYLTSYAPDKLTYKARTARENVAVFSEVFFPWGWEATIDGKPVEIGRVDYVLRAMRVPAGEHEITMAFRPHKVERAETWSMITVILILLIAVAAGVNAFAPGLMKRCKCKAKDESAK